MKLIGNKSILQTQLERMFSCAAERTSLFTHLVYVRLNIKDGASVFSSSNGFMALLSASDDFRCEGSGSVLLPPSILPIVKQCSGEHDIEIVMEDGEIKILNGKAAITLMEEEYENFREIELDHSALEEWRSVSKTQLMDGIQLTLPAITGKLINDVYEYIEINESFCRASDGHRYLRYDSDFSSVPMMIPRRSAMELVKLLRQHKPAEVRISRTPTRRIFEIYFNEDSTNPTYFMTGLPSVELPDLEDALFTPAQNNEIEFLLDRKGLLEAFRRVSVTMDAKSPQVVMDFDNTDLTLRSRDSFGNHSSINVPCQPVTNDVNSTVMVNSAHFQSVLKFTRGEEVRLRVPDAEGTNPVLLEDELGKFKGVVSNLKSVSYDIYDDLDDFEYYDEDFSYEGDNFSFDEDVDDDNLDLNFDLN